MRSAFSISPERGAGFVLPAAVFLLVVMATLGAFIVQIVAAGHVVVAQDVQGMRALQAARAGIERGLYAVQVDGNCPGGMLADLPGLTGFKVSWQCQAHAFTDAAVSRTVWQITATACSTRGASCPSTLDAELQGSDYTERQLVVLTER